MSRITNHEQRLNIKFCVKLGKTFSETHQLLQQAYGEEAISKSQVHQWHRRFKAGLESVEDHPRGGRPATARNDGMVARVRAEIERDPRQSMDDLIDMLGISKGSVFAILRHDLKLRRDRGNGRDADPVWRPINPADDHPESNQPAGKRKSGQGAAAASKRGRRSKPPVTADL